MNRTQRTERPLVYEPEAPVFSLDSGVIETSSLDSPYTLFVPLHYEPRYAYPLIVWLHGPGWDERQLMRLMPLISMRNYVAVAPRGSTPMDPNRTQAGYTWRQTDREIQQAEQCVFDCVAKARRKFNISPRRVFLAGFDTGGTMAFRIAMHHPESFGGVVSMCGGFPNSQAPFRNLSKIRGLPIFLAVGRDSKQYPPDVACGDLRLFHSAGMSVTLRQYPYGHELAPQMLSDMDRWIIEQITVANRETADTNL